MFGTSRLLTNSVWLSTAGFISLAVACAALWRGRRHWRSAPPAAVGLACFGLVVLGNLFLLMFYYWGHLDDPIVGRLALPTFALMALAIAYAVQTFSRPRRHLAAVAVAGAVLAYFWTGLIANAQFTGLDTLETELEWERDFVAARPPGDRLIITNKSALPWMLRMTPAIAIEQARTRMDALRFQLAHHTFREILVTQTYLPTTANGNYELDPRDRLPEWWVLKPVAEHRFGTRLDRVSRLVAINPPPKKEGKGAVRPAPKPPPGRPRAGPNGRGTTR